MDKITRNGLKLDQVTANHQVGTTELTNAPILLPNFFQLKSFTDQLSDEEFTLLSLLSLTRK